MKGRLNRDPAKRKLKRARQRAAGSFPDRVTEDPVSGKPVSHSQSSHASNPRARSRARDGEKKMNASREAVLEDEDERRAGEAADMDTGSSPGDPPGSRPVR